MAIRSFKICPECNHKNLPEWIECEKCEADLQRVKVTIEDDSKKEVMVKQENKIPRLVKICPSCKKINLANAKVCQQCNFDLSLVIATFNNNDVKKKTIKLISDDNQCEIIIDSNYMLFGRVISKYPYFATKGCVSRRHFKLFFLGEKLMIKNCASADPSRSVITFINEHQLRENEQIELKNGDLIGLGGDNFNKYEQAAYFQVVME